MFAMKVLQSPGKYPSIGHKKLSGAASRIMIYYMKHLALEIHEQDPTPLNRTTCCLFRLYLQNRPACRNILKTFWSFCEMADVFSQGGWGPYTKEVGI